MNTDLRPSNPDLGSYGERLAQDILFSTNCHGLGVIESFNPAKQSATASLGYKKVLVNGSYHDYPVLVDCPVVLVGGGGAYLTFPIAKGDPCLILFNDRDMDAWVASGQVRPPNTDRAHAFADAIVLVGVRPFSKALPSYSPTSIQLFYGSTLIELDTKIGISNSVTSLRTILNGLIDILVTLTGQIVPTTGMTSANAAANVAALNAYKLQIAGLLK